MRRNARVYVVEDDPELTQSLQIALDSIGAQATFFTSAESFLDTYVESRDDERPRCLLLDVMLPGMTGIDLQSELRNRRVDMPVIVMTGRSTVPMAVRAIKGGAVDFLEKPLHRRHLLEQIDRAIEEDVEQRPHRVKRQKVASLLPTLTHREREVLDLLLEGMTNKKLAHELQISIKTASKHTSRVFAKLGTRNVVELSQLLGEMAQR